MPRFLPLLLLFAPLAPAADPQPVGKAENVLVVTLDGFRWQELFGGADETYMDAKQGVKDAAGLKKKYLRDTAEERREAVRPDVVLFGESLPTDAVGTLQRELRTGFDVVFSVGTTSVFPYIAGPVLDAHHRRKACVAINPGETDVSEFVTVKLPLRAAEALDAIWAGYNGG